MHLPLLENVALKDSDDKPRQWLDEYGENKDPYILCNVISNNATRTSAGDIEAYIESHMPQPYAL